MKLQERIETTALALGSAVLFVCFFQFNGWLFADLLYREGVNWVFLPAGFRIILVLVLGLPGAMGIMWGTWFLDRDLIGTNSMWLAVLNGVVSGFTPLWVLKMLERGKRTQHLLQEMTAQHLLNFTLIFAAASSVAHHVVWLLMGRADVNIWVDVWPMFIGDAIGALLMLYGFKLLLSRLKIKRL
ncbi:MAG: hypothetical protein KA393_02370 [Limnohabitans sp.]|nr:hypothetical protein [Limnohabitans sp.]